MPLDQRYMMIFYVYLSMFFVIWAHREFYFVRGQIKSRSVKILFYGLFGISLVLWTGYSLERAFVWSRETLWRGADRSDGLTWKFIDRRHWFPQNDPTNSVSSTPLPR